ncbi:MAG: hypothetical protein ACI92I_000525 [Acidimicrobiales bacterium]|jgi:hypothetical protein
MKFLLLILLVITVFIPAQTEADTSACKMEEKIVLSDCSYVIHTIIIHEHDIRITFDSVDRTEALTCLINSDPRKYEEKEPLIIDVNGDQRWSEKE